MVPGVRLPWNNVGGPLRALRAALHRVLPQSVPGLVVSKTQSQT